MATRGTTLLAALESATALPEHAPAAARGCSCPW